MSLPHRPAVLVTGASRRLGRHIALYLAQRGFDLAIHQRTGGEAGGALLDDLQQLGAKTVLLSADLADAAQTESLVPAAVQALGRLDGVVNNAARFEHDQIDSFSAEAWQAHGLPNTVAPILLARALHRHCAASQQRGCVVNLLDQKLWNPNPDHLSYTLSKAALQAATPLLAQALAPWVRVLGVAPGLTLGSPDIDADRLAALQAQTPLGHGVQPDDVAQAVHFALTNPSLTGSHLIVDAGSHLTRMPRDFAFT